MRVEPAGATDKLVKSMSFGLIHSLSAILAFLKKQPSLLRLSCAAELLHFLNATGADGCRMCGRYWIGGKMGRRKEEVARLAGIEPTTLGFGGQYSIH